MKIRYTFTVGEAHYIGNAVSHWIGYFQNELMILSQISPERLECINENLEALYAIQKKLIEEPEHLNETR